MVMATPALRSLRAMIDGELWAVGKDKALHLYNGSKVFDHFISNNDKGLIPFLDVVGHIKNLHFHTGVIMPHSFRSALMFYFGNVGNRVGYDRNSRGFMLTSRVEERVRPEPTVEHYLKIIDTIGGKRVLETPVLTVTDDEDRKFDEKYGDMRRPYIVFITGAQYGPSKRWPEAYFSQLADRVVEAFGVDVNLLPGSGEESLARKICHDVTHKENVAMRFMDVRDLKVCLSRATAVVSNDTGPRHMAAALSVPTVVLLGPMDEQYTRYESECTHVISKEVPCRPCNKKTCEKNHLCLAEITPDEVFHKLEEILETRSSKDH